jgi:hypothetical protein
MLLFSVYAVSNMNVLKTIETFDAPLFQNLSCFSFDLSQTLLTLLKFIEKNI